MHIAIASDHGGYAYKDALICHIQSLGHTVEDLGCYTQESVNYAEYAIALSEAVAAGRFERGILLCGTGIGMSIAANKVPGIRCALCSEPLSAALTREHNDSNVLAMGARIIGVELAKEIATVWLRTAFSGGRHQARIDAISAYERQHFE